jgi:translation machinery-associated protein 16
MLKEDREYSAGFWLPDLEDEDNLNLLRGWNGEWSSLSRLKYIRLTRNGVRKESSFPPKGES